MSDAPTVNIPLLRKAVEWVEAEAARPRAEREWNQLLWASRTDCGTAFCVAGIVCQWNGDETTSLAGGGAVRDANGKVWSTPERAAQLLGIQEVDNSAGRGLFAAHNSAADIRGHAERIAGERL